MRIIWKTAEDKVCVQTVNVASGRTVGRDGDLQHPAFHPCKYAVQFISYESAATMSTRIAATSGPVLKDAVMVTVHESET